jgi:hypothetical protein
MLTFILPAISAILCAAIEYIRIKLTYGKVVNVSKFWSVTIAFVFFGICLALSVDYYDDVMPIQILIYGIYFAGCRGFMYDIVLNLLRGLSISYKSWSTNSLIDNILNPTMSFWAIRVVYLAVSLFFGWIYSFY